MKITKIFIAAAIVCGAVSLHAQVKYTNPVYGSDFPDPTVVRHQDGMFYTYATGGKLLRSKNMVQWTKLDNAISRPTWNDSIKPDGTKDSYSIWACDVSYMDGKYYMQYASALWGNGYRTGVGVAVGDTPTKFTDKGKLFRSTEIGVWNSIDPCYYQEKDKRYIIWGSFNDICIAELNEDGLSVKNFKPIDNPNEKSKMKRFSGATKIAGGAFEGPMIYKRGKYYYLFCSVGTCCEGENSTYRTVVGRSTNIKGPYVNKQGGDMRNDNYTTIIKGNDRFKGPGHNSEIVTDDEGQDWLLYHSYDKNNNFNGRLLLIDKINWVNDWPEVGDGTPSTTEQDGPVFYTGDGANMTYKMVNADLSMSKWKGWVATNSDD
ncbi:MAG: family 43 glycosylhydrolase, partial [Bacteroidaceae bacterium]|nr:family 43 glycosylhydrolase [Bacteroidaceae bacterium]